MFDVPRPGTPRGRMLARQHADTAAGRFPDRIFAFDFDLIRAGQHDEQTLTITSMGGRHVRFLAMQGRIPEDLTGLFLSHARIRILLNGQDNFVGTVAGPDQNSCTMAMLFARQQRASWYWFRAAPRMRAGDFLTIRVDNTFPVGEGAPSFTPQVAIRMIDDKLWTELFVRDAVAAGWR